MEQMFYAGRRSEFMKRVGVDTIAVVPAGRLQVRNDDVDHGFRQNSDFFYLTGFAEPDAIAVFDPSHDTEQYILFVRPRDPDMEAWNGLRAGVEGAKDRFGADAAHPVSEFAEWLGRRLTGRSKVVYALGNTAHDDTVVGAFRRGWPSRVRSGLVMPEAIVDPTPIIAEMRLVKTTDEIDALREACRISAIGHVEAMKFAAPGRTERQVQAALEYVFGVMDSERIGYGSIVAGGDNACILHYVENDQPLVDGDLLLIDAGAEYRHYTADITRTFPVNGRFTPPQRAVYDLVLDTERRVIEMCAPGLPYADMHRTVTELLSTGLVNLGLLPEPADEALAKGWYRQFFFHGTGHWLGSDVHDAGAYRLDGDPRPLAPGMAFTVEPGVYIARDKSTVTLSEAPYDPDEVAKLTLERGLTATRAELDRRAEEAGSRTFDVPGEFLGIGVRVEDDILITADGYENMTSLVPSDADAIEALCAEASELPLFQ
ncbi:MAG: aminopeptidase P N-terminal domain-containing protein [Acidimicrobiia bacterium]|nr:aminopeptidase P N-terminal domain-containing protein [Acidimicrobiia bacterium]